MAIELTGNRGHVAFTGATGVSGGDGVGAVTSVNGKIGAVVLTAQDVGALPADASITDLENVATKEYVDAAISSIDPDFEGAADFATKEYVQEALKDVSVDVSLDDYYTKREVDAKIESELTEGVTLENYYTKNEVVDRIYSAIDETVLYNPNFNLDNFATHDDVAQKITEAQLDGAEVDMSMYYNKTDTELLVEQALDSYTDHTLNNLYYLKEEVDEMIPETSSFVSRTEMNETLEEFDPLENVPVGFPVTSFGGHGVNRWPLYKSPWRDVPIGVNGSGYAIAPTVMTSNYHPKNVAGSDLIMQFGKACGIEVAAGLDTIKKKLSKGVPVMYTTVTGSSEGDGGYKPEKFTWSHLPDWYRDTTNSPQSAHVIWIVNDNSVIKWNDASLAQSGARGFNIYSGDIVWVINETMMAYIRYGITNWDTVVRLFNRMWYANNKSGLESTDVQSAIDELAEQIKGLEYEVPEGVITEEEVDEKITTRLQNVSAMVSAAEADANAYTDSKVKNLASQTYVQDYVSESLEGVGAIQGEKGEKGDPFTYEDFTPAQLAALKGEKGDPGEKGADGTMTFEDLTEEQKASLKGDKGDKGDTGAPFTYDMFTEEQLAALKGEKGEDGSIVFEELTEEQKATLKGEPGVYIGTNPTADATVWINPEGDSSGNFATEGYVDSAIAALNLSDYQTAEQVQAAITAALGAIGVAEEGTY